MIISEFTDGKFLKWEFKCDKCKKILNKARKNEFKDKTGTLCNPCFIPSHICNNLCSEKEIVCRNC